MNIFHDDIERTHFLLLLQEGLHRYGHKVHAFCLMNNHVHLVIQVGTTDLSKIMQNLSFRYTRWFNSRQKRMGHLFQGRFKAILVDEDSYLLELVRYTHLNPIRIGLVEKVIDYLWSSHRAYMGLETLPWLECDIVLSRFSSDLNHARCVYEDFVLSALNEKRKDEFHSGAQDSRVLGDDYFAEQILKEIGEEKRTLALDDCIEKVCDFYKLQSDDLSRAGSQRLPSEARSVVAYLMKEYGKESLTNIAKHFHRDVSTLSGAIHNLEVRMSECPSVRDKVEGLRTIITP